MTTTSRGLAALAVAICALYGLAPPASARVRHHRHHAVVVAPAPPLAPRPYVLARDPAEFYPEQIEGGVRGNLSFNNQIRKHVDPLNANGGGG